MRAPITWHDSEEVRQLWEDYQRATVFVLEIIRTDGTNAVTLPKILKQDAKAGRAIERLKEIYGLSAMPK